MNKDIDEFEKENIELKKNLKKLKKELGREIENNNNVNKEADDLFEKNIKISENYQKLQKKYEELFNNNKDKEAKIINQGDLTDFDSINNDQISNININGSRNLMIKNLKTKNEELEQQIIELENELKEQDEELIELNNELKNKEEKLDECNSIINDIKDKNYELQKKLKQLNDKISTFDNQNIDKSLNLSEKKNINGNNKELDEEQLIPENYNIIKCVHLTINNKQYKWYILEKINKDKKFQKSTSNKKQFQKNINLTEDEDSFDNISYEDFIFIPEKNKVILNKFKLPMNDSIENEKIISNLESEIKTLEKRYKKKEKDFNVLNLNFTNLLQQTKNSNIKLEKLKNTVEILKEENNNLNRNLMKYTNKNNYLGLSFIEDNENDNHFLNDECFEEILDELDGKAKINDYKYQSKNELYIKQNIINNRNDKNFYGSANKFYQQNFKTIDNNSETNIIKENNSVIKNLKESFKTLLNQIEPASNAKATIASIMKQLGHNDNEIYKILGYNQRGVINVPNSYTNKYKYKK